MGKAAEFGDASVPLLGALVGGRLYNIVRPPEFKLNPANFWCSLTEDLSNDKAEQRSSGISWQRPNLRRY